jgi:hypothetical protein
LFKKVQLSATEITALKAMSVSHQRVRVLSGVRLLISAVIAGAGAVVTLAAVPATWVTVVGALWAGVYSVGLASWADRELLRAVKLQEKFEVEFFALPWNETAAGAEVRGADASSLSKRFKDKKIAEDWAALADLPRPFDVLARQLQNLAWGSRIRRRYADVVGAAVIVWTVGGVAIGAIGGLTVSEVVVRWFVPSLGGLLLGIDTFRQQRAVAKERERVVDYGEKETLKAAGRIAEPTTAGELLVLSRQLQDVLFRTRCRAPRVPKKLFYLRYYSDDAADFCEPVHRLAKALAVSPSTP